MFRRLKNKNHLPRLVCDVYKRVNGGKCLGLKISRNSYGISQKFCSPQVSRARERTNFKKTITSIRVDYLCFSVQRTVSFFFFPLPSLLRAEKYLDHMGARNLPPHSREIFSLSKSEVENSTSSFRLDI